jgi:hypothetical protein
VFSQDWSYDTIPDKNIKEVRIYRIKFINGINSKDSSLKAVRFYDNGLKSHEVYFGNCNDRICNDSIWYFYNDKKLLTKVIDSEGIGEQHKTTILFSYDAKNNNTKRLYLDEKSEIRQTITFTRIYNDKEQLQLLIDTTLGTHTALTVSRTKYFYNHNNILIKTMYYYKDTIHGQENMSSADNPNKKYNIGLSGLTNSDNSEKNGLYIQSIYYTSDKKNKIKYVDNYYYK